MLSEGCLDDRAIRVGACRRHTRTVTIHATREVGELSGCMGQCASSRRTTEEMSDRWEDQQKARKGI